MVHDRKANTVLESMTKQTQQGNDDSNPPPKNNEILLNGSDVLGVDGDVKMPQVSSERAAACEEQIRVQELVLKHLLERKAFLNEEVETTRLRYQRLLERKVLLQERKLHLRAARIKHLTLQKELRDSLAKSRERLARLTKLEQLVENDSLSFDAASCELSAISEEVELLPSEVKEDEEPSVANSKESFEIDIMDQNNHPAEFEMVEDDVSSFLPATSAPPQIQSLLHIRDFNNRRRVRSKSLMTFLPSISPSLLGEIIVLAMREANALDDDSTKPSSRRALLRNTCLDFGLLSPLDTEPNLPIEVWNVEDEDDRLTQQPVDPNVLLCPYELAGVCADGFCPYQHSTKQTLSREQIPLPSLSLHPSKEQDKNPPEVAVSTTYSNQGEPSTITKPEMALVTDSSVDINPYPNPNTTIDIDMDFIALPMSEADDAMSIESSGSENEEDDDDNGGLLGLSSAMASSTFSFWWGGRIEPSDGSLDEMIRNMQGAAAATATAAMQNINSTLESLAYEVEVSRLEIHAGRFDMATSVSSVEFGNQPEWYKMLRETMQEAVKISFLYPSMPLSFIRSSFENQAILAILSAFLFSMKTAPVIESTLIDCVVDCCSSMRSDTGGGSTDGSIEFTISDFRNVLLGSQHSDWGVAQIAEQDDILAKMMDLKASLAWVKQCFGPFSPHRTSLHRVDNHILQPCWAAARRWISLLKPEETMWASVKATLLMGNIVLGCLEWFAAHIQGDALSASLTAALITIDATASQILKGLSKHFAHIPMMDVLLSPLFAANVTTSTYLRLYSVSHHRLETLLALNPNQRKDQKRPSVILTQFSELLWCQFVHLRMALPIESGEESSTDEHQAEQSAKTSTRSKRYAWELCKGIEEENQCLMDRIQTMGIHLHHVSQEGDRILSHAMSNTNSSLSTSSSQLDASQTLVLQHVASNVLEWIFCEGSWNNATAERHSVDLNGIPLGPVVTDGRATSKSTMILTPPEGISSFPRSLLLAGYAMQNLSLSGCGLALLPVSFGLYFPNLLSLDLSSNRLKQIPLSFRSMLCLERLVLSRNAITELHGEELMASLLYLNVSHNCLTRSSLLVLSSFTESLGRRCFQLEELDLTWNLLDAVTLQLLEEEVIPKWTLQIKGLRSVQWRPQQQQQQQEPVEASTPAATAGTPTTPTMSKQ